MTWAPYSEEPRSRFSESPNSALRMTGWSLPSNWWRGLPLGGMAEAGVRNLRDVLGGLGGPAQTPTYAKGMASNYYGVPQTNPPRGPFTKGGGYQAVYSPVPPSELRLPGAPRSYEDRSAFIGGGPVAIRPPIGRDFNAVNEGAQAAQNIWQEQYDRYIAGLQATEAEVRAGYSSDIAATQDEIDDLRAAAAALGMPFDEYMARRKEIGGDVGDAAKLTGSIKPAVNKVYDDATAEMKDVLDKIGVNFGPQVAEQLTGRVRDFEDTMEDVIRTDETAVDLVHQRSGELAKAMAQAAYSNDIYAALDAETKINAQLTQRTEEAQEQLARQKAAMAAAMAAARSRYEAEFELGQPSFDDVLGSTWNEYFAREGVPEHQRQAALGIWQAVSADPQNMLNENSFRRGLNEYMNQGIMSSLGVTAEMIEGADDPTGLISLMNSRDFGQMFQTGQTAPLEAQLVAMFGGDAKARTRARTIIRQGSNNADDFQTTRSPEFQHLRNMYTSRNELSKNWDDVISKFGPTVDENQVARSPSGFVFPVVGGGKYSNSFGYKRSAKAQASGKRPVHQGIDIMAPRGSNLVAPVNGSVVKSGYSNIGGNYVTIRDSQGNRHYFAHLDKHARNLQPGSKVTAGRTFIGTVGNTGNARDTSPHLHYQVSNKNGGLINPYKWLRATGQ